MPFNIGGVMAGKQGIYVRISEQDEKMLKFIAGYQGVSCAQTVREVLEKNISQMYEKTVQEIKKTL